MSPARPAVLRNVLVPHVGEIVHTIHIVPNVLLWKVRNWRKRGLDIANLWLV
jgi:hypothetical protein